MPTTFVRGDIFATEGIAAYAHGCNCSGHMDSGVAAAFKKRWPGMFEEYEKRCADKRFQLGDVLAWSDGSHTIYSLAIQQHWKTKSKLAAFTRALDKTIALATGVGITSIGLPRIGAGVGGLDWTRVRKILAEAGESTPISIVVFEQFVRAQTA
jgi:O-acetyl-ADP-ribose deacetylase (regulator of RNase III)